MISFFEFQGPHESELSADFQKEFRQWERFPCPVNPSHKAMRRRIGPLHHFVMHNDRNQEIIWGAQITMHKNAIERLQHQGFTGFRVNPAQVTFRDGVTSNDYLEFIVTGWAGVAQPESGVRVVESCPGCKWKKYSAITDFEKVIDWSQWTGEDFFIVWPFSRHRFCTERTSDWLKSSGLRFSARSPFGGLARRLGDQVWKTSGSGVGFVFDLGGLARPFNFNHSGFGLPHPFALFGRRAPRTLALRSFVLFVRSAARPFALAHHHSHSRQTQA